MIPLVTIALAVLTFAVYYCFSRRKARYPPGPIGLPLVGHLFLVGLRAYKKFDEWGKKYGPIFSVRLGPLPTVVITDAKLIREAFNDINFAGKPDNKAFHLFPDGKYGVVQTDGDAWVEQRRFALRNLRDFGFGKNKIEVTIIDEVQVILDWMKKEEGHPFSLDLKFRLSILNVLSSLTTGERHDLDDPKLTHLLEIGNKAFNDITANGAIFYPELAELFPNVSGWNSFARSVKEFQEVFHAAVRQHEQNPADEACPRDFIDVYQAEIKKTTDPQSSFYKEKGRKGLIAVVGDLHTAGSETTSQTLRWIILYLIRHPEVQKKLHKEIDEVIGHNRLPCLADRPNMRYMEALTMEVFRMSSLVPMGVFHSTMTDVEFQGFRIPKKTMVIANLYSAHYNKETWADPENFRPERFLSADGNAIVRNDSLIPFGVGKRACLGETLARDEIFLYTTSIFQKFQILVDPANPKPSMEPVSGFLLTPQPFSVVMKDRIA